MLPIVRVEKATPIKLLHLISTAREIDRAEMVSMRWRTLEEEWPDIVVSLTGPSAMGYVASVGDTPIACAGAIPVWPGVWTTFGFGSDRWPEAAYAMSRTVRRVLLPKMREAGGRRVFCYVHAVNTKAQRWMQGMGASVLAVIPGFTRGGDDVVMLGWEL